MMTGKTQILGIADVNVVENIVASLLDVMKNTTPDLHTRKITSHPTTGGMLSLPTSWKGKRDVLILDYKGKFAILLPVEK